MIEDKTLSEIEEAWRRLRAFVDGLAVSYERYEGGPPPDAKRIQRFMQQLEEE